MSRFEHLESYAIRLTAKAPLHIGSGKSFTKKEYYYNPSKKTVSILNEDQMLNLILEKGLLKHYEKFILEKPYQYLKDFFEEWGVTTEEIDRMTRYTTDIGNALTPDKSRVEIFEFVRNSRGFAYIPGSSIKGAIRTALLTKIIRDENVRQNFNSLPDRRSTEVKDLEAELLHTLRLTNQKRDAVNSVMKGIMISDSEPIPNEDIVLCRKDDLSISGNIHSLNVIRECIKPGISIKATMTLDRTVLKKIDAPYIVSAIEEYGKYYVSQYVSRYQKPSDWVSENFSNCIILGGGAGYFSKNIVYPVSPGANGLRSVSNLMNYKFKNHKHNKDIDLGISPRLLKCTTYGNGLYHMGVCQIEIAEA